MDSKGAQHSYQAKEKGIDVITRIMNSMARKPTVPDKFKEYIDLPYKFMPTWKPCLSGGKGIALVQEFDEPTNSLHYSKRVASEFINWIERHCVGSSGLERFRKKHGIAAHDIGGAEMVVGCNQTDLVNYVKALRKQFDEGQKERILNYVQEVYKAVKKRIKPFVRQCFSDPRFEITEQEENVLSSKRVIYGVRCVNHITSADRHITSADRPGELFVSYIESLVLTTATKFPKDYVGAIYCSETFYPIKTNRDFRDKMGIRQWADTTVALNLDTLERYWEYLHEVLYPTYHEELVVRAPKFHEQVVETVEKPRKVDVEKLIRDTIGNIKNMGPYSSCMAHKIRVREVMNTRLKRSDPGRDFFPDTELACESHVSYNMQRWFPVFIEMRALQAGGLIPDDIEMPSIPDITIGKLELPDTMKDFREEHGMKTQGNVTRIGWPNAYSNDVQTLYDYWLILFMMSKGDWNTGGTYEEELVVRAPEPSTLRSILLKAIKSLYVYLLPADDPSVDFDVEDVGKRGKIFHVIGRNRTTRIDAKLPGQIELEVFIQYGYARAGTPPETQLALFRDMYHMGHAGFSTAYTNNEFILYKYWMALYGVTFVNDIRSIIKILKLPDPDHIADKGEMFKLFYIPPAHLSDDKPLYGLALVTFKRGIRTTSSSRTRTRVDEVYVFNRLFKAIEDKLFDNRTEAIEFRKKHNVWHKKYASPVSANPIDLNNYVTGLAVLSKYYEEEGEYHEELVVRAPKQSKIKPIVLKAIKSLYVYLLPADDPSVDFDVEEYRSHADKLFRIIRRGEYPADILPGRIEREVFNQYGYARAGTPFEAQLALFRDIYNMDHGGLSTYTAYTNNEYILYKYWMALYGVTFVNDIRSIIKILKLPDPDHIADKGEMFKLSYFSSNMNKPVYALALTTFDDSEIYIFTRLFKAIENKLFDNRTEAIEFRKKHNVWHKKYASPVSANPIDLNNYVTRLVELSKYYEEEGEYHEELVVRVPTSHEQVVKTVEKPRKADVEKLIRDTIGNIKDMEPYSSSCMIYKIRVAQVMYNLGGYFFPKVELACRSHVSPNMEQFIGQLFPVFIEMRALQAGGLIPDDIEMPSIPDITIGKLEPFDTEVPLEAPFPDTTIIGELEPFILDIMKFREEHGMKTLGNPNISGWPNAYSNDVQTLYDYWLILLMMSKGDWDAGGTYEEELIVRASDAQDVRANYVQEIFNYINDLRRECRTDTEINNSFYNEWNTCWTDPLSIRLAPTTSLQYEDITPEQKIYWIDVEGDCSWDFISWLEERVTEVRGTSASELRNFYKMWGADPAYGTLTQLRAYYRSLLSLYEVGRPDVGTYEEELVVRSDINAGVDVQGKYEEELVAMRAPSKMSEAGKKAWKTIRKKQRTEIIASINNLRQDVMDRWLEFYGEKEITIEESSDKAFRPEPRIVIEYIERKVHKELSQYEHFYVPVVEYRRTPNGRIIGFNKPFPVKIDINWKIREAFDMQDTTAPSLGKLHKYWTTMERWYTVAKATINNIVTVENNCMGYDKNIDNMIKDRRSNGQLLRFELMAYQPIEDELVFYVKKDVPPGLGTGYLARLEGCALHKMGIDTTDLINSDADIWTNYEFRKKHNVLTGKGSFSPAGTMEAVHAYWELLADVGRYHEELVVRAIDDEYEERTIEEIREDLKIDIVESLQAIEELLPESHKLGDNEKIDVIKLDGLYQAVIRGGDDKLIDTMEYLGLNSLEPEGGWDSYRKRMLGYSDQPPRSDDITSYKKYWTSLSDAVEETRDTGETTAEYVPIIKPFTDEELEYVMGLGSKYEEELVVRAPLPADPNEPKATPWTKKEYIDFISSNAEMANNYAILYWVHEGREIPNEFADAKCAYAGFDVHTDKFRKIGYEFYNVYQPRTDCKVGYTNYLEKYIVEEVMGYNLEQFRSAYLLGYDIPGSNHLNTNYHYTDSLSALYDYWGILKDAMSARNLYVDEQLRGGKHYHEELIVRSESGQLTDRIQRQQWRAPGKQMIDAFRRRSLADWLAKKLVKDGYTISGMNKVGYFQLKNDGYTDANILDISKAFNLNLSPVSSPPDDEGKLVGYINRLRSIIKSRAKDTTDDCWDSEIAVVNWSGKNPRWWPYVRNCKDSSAFLRWLGLQAYYGKVGLVEVDDQTGFDKFRDEFFARPDGLANPENVSDFFQALVEMAEGGHEEKLVVRAPGKQMIDDHEEELVVRSK